MPGKTACRHTDQSGDYDYAQLASSAALRQERWKICLPTSSGFLLYSWGGWILLSVPGLIGNVIAIFENGEWRKRNVRPDARIDCVHHSIDAGVFDYDVKVGKGDQLISKGHAAIQEFRGAVR